MEEDGSGDGTSVPDDDLRANELNNLMRIVCRDRLRKYQKYAITVSVK